MIRRRFCNLGLVISLAVLSDLGYAGMLDKSWELGADWWQRTEQWAESTWQETQEWFAADPGEGFARLWEAAMPRLDKARILEDRHASLPQQSWLGEDQASNRQAINELLDEVAEILSGASGESYRERIQALETAIDETQIEIAELRQERVVAPQRSTWRKTVADYDTAISERTEQIAAYSEELDALRREFATELRRMGLELTQEQLEFLLSSVVGDDVVDMAIAFDNVKTITEQLERLISESQEDIATARRYYGIYTVLLRVLDHMHKQAIDAIETDYLHRIDDIIARTQLLLAETKNLRRQTRGEHPILSANIEAQRLTLEVASFYRGYLEEQARTVAKARSRLARDLAIAENTYETVKVSGELIALMQSSQQLLDTLMSRQVPALRTFENLQMKREFEKLTERLRNG